MTGDPKTARPRSNARGTPPQAKTYAWIWDRVADGRIWEIQPADHHIKPRRFYLETRNHFAQRGIKAMVVKRDRMIYIQVLDEATKKDDQTVYALQGKMPYLQRWLLPTQVEPESPPDPGEETEDDPAPPRPRKKLRPRGGNWGRGPSKNYVPARQLEAYVLTVMNRYFDRAMTVTEITRAADYVLRDAPAETRYAHNAQVRLVLQKLVADEGTPIFSRMATDEESRLMGFRVNVVHLYSPTDPVPPWTTKHHAEIMQRYPEPRVAPIHAPASRRLPSEDETPDNIPPAFRRVPPTPERVIIEQPKYVVTTPVLTGVVMPPETQTAPTQPKPAPPPQRINGTLLERVAALSRDLAQLAIDLETDRRAAEQRDHKLEAELMADNERLKKERDAAVDQLRAIANAQQAMSAIFEAIKD